MLRMLIALFIMLPMAAAQEDAPVIDFGSLLDEMHDLSSLAKLPDPWFTTVQFSSYDRRSVSTEATAWYSNADGFGREPVPGFSEVLEAAGEDGVGLYLLAEVEGPGAMVRGWSAGMGGTIQVFLDDQETPLFEGTAYDFLARRSLAFLDQAGVELDCGDAFCQQDADYMPLPFEKSFRATWKGKIDELHFYHLEVRLYDEGTKVKTFDPKLDPKTYESKLRTAVKALTEPGSDVEGERFEEKTDLKPDGLWTWEIPYGDKPGAITELSLQLMGSDLEKALRGTLLRIAFDGAQKAQVEGPLGDLFGSGPGVNPFNSLPLAVGEDGTFTCRFVMPFKEKVSLSLLNSTDEALKASAAVRIKPWEWDERSLYFRAKWRTHNFVDLRTGPFDVPYIVTVGRGRFVGAATMLVNPSPIPHPYGSWWGEGDEKIFVDGEAFPSFYGTGSEDYYNYSWSRPDLFDHPYCGQPLDTGPGNQGYCSNHRWHVIDDIPFQESFAFYMEAWHHSARPGFCYSCIAYHYARPGAIDDHCRVQRSELIVPPVPPMEPEATFGARDSVIHNFKDMEITVEGGALRLDASQTCASRGRLIAWKAGAGDKLKVNLPLEKEGDLQINMVAAHWPEGGTVRILANGSPLTVENLGGAGLGERGVETVVLKSAFARRLLSTGFEKFPVKPGELELVIECVEAGHFGFDYLWVR